MLGGLVPRAIVTPYACRVRFFAFLFKFRPTLIVLILKFELSCFLLIVFERLFVLVAVFFSLKRLIRAGIVVGTLAPTLRFKLIAALFYWREL